MSHAASHEELMRVENERYHTFINIALFLAVLTGIEIVIIFLPWAFWIIMTGLVVLSLIKFICVILWFMHLIYDKILLFWLFLTGLIIATGTMIALLLLFSADDVDLEPLIGADTIVATQSI
ncbi:MAG: cytochrome C oxidase subunit IV family protein [Verrucomicrobiota bacterium]